MKDKNVFKLYRDICNSHDIIDAAKFKPVSDQDYARIMLELKMRLNPNQYQVLTYRYGLGEDDSFHSMEETGKELGLTRERVRQMEHAALKKMKHYNKLPALFGFFELPDDPNSIEHLKLSVRTRECLRRYAGITTITGIKDFDGDWLKIRHLGRRGVSEIEEKMTLAGYPDFKILL